MSEALARAQYREHAVKYKQQFLSGNVSKTYTQNPSTTTTWYSYDVYGRVTWMLQDIEGLGVRSIDYEYDFATGQVVKVIYQKYQDPQQDVHKDYFEHKYTYNVAGELYKVETSTNGVVYKEQAKYKYYETGALKRVEVAENVQGIDYIYNLNGQLKAINHPSRSSSLDPGKDGTNGMPNDLFGFAIDYYNGDYTRTNTPTPITVATGHENYNQYNGNIKATRWSTSNIDNGSQASQLFTYNKNNWLKSANFGTVNNSGGITPNSYGNYKVDGLTYDANGNIKTLNRNKNGNGSNTMDKLTYNYTKELPNRLTHVDDAIGNAGVQDIDDQDVGNYIYNSIGQLKENIKEKVKYEYNASGLVTKVFYNNVLKVQFYYSDKGHRVKKEKYTNGTIEKTTHYVRDASGSIIAIYENQEQKELLIYGASRLGMYNKVDGSAVYQLTDHLGNIRVVVGKSAEGEVLPASNSATDYYPFGMPMPNRKIVNGEPYRYAYQGQEKDDETGKEAFQLRLWDGRIGRWLSPDPAKQFSSPYLGMGNNPIKFIDKKGDSLDLSDIYKMKEGKYINQEAITTIETFAKTKDGYEHFSKYAKKGQKIGNLPAFKKDGIYHKKGIDYRLEGQLSPETIKAYRGAAGGVTSLTKVGGRWLITVEFTGNNSFEQLVNLTHEVFIHATRNTFDVIDDGLENSSGIPNFIKKNKNIHYIHYDHEHEYWLQSKSLKTHYNTHGYTILRYGNEKLNGKKLSNEQIWNKIILSQGKDF